MTLNITPLADLPALNEDERDDASFRGKDRAWSALVSVFDKYSREQGLTYEALGKRIKRSKSQVQRWLSSSFNMNLSSLGLLAEALDSDLIIEVRPREKSNAIRNYVHPVEREKARTFSGHSGTHIKQMTLSEADQSFSNSASSSSKITFIGELEDA